MTKVLHAVLIVVIAALCIAMALATADADERNAMVAIRAHVPGLTSAWSDSRLSQVCQSIYSYTSYITCKDGHVSGLDFSSLFTTTDSIGALGNITGLRFLKSLSVGPYMRVKDLDVWYTQLPNLTSLSFSNLAYYSPISPIFSANFTDNPFLTSLAFTDYNTSVFPLEITGAPGLKSLSISVPKLTTFPSNFLDGMNLTSLSFSFTGSSGTALREFPDFSHLTYLDTLDMSSTPIQELQDNFTSLVNLRTLKLDYCSYLTKIAPSVSNCVKLQTLSCSSCRLNRADSLPNLSATRLNELTLTSNSITVWPDGLCQLSTNPLSPGLVLNLAYNALIDPPSCFANVVGLHTAYFISADFTSFPTIFATMPTIYSLTISSSYQMAGGIPNLSGMTSLTFLDLRRCALDGNFPSGLPTSIINLYLSNNKLTGVLADGVFSGLRSLANLDLTDNDLVGPFPSSISDTSLYNLLAANNAFTSLPNSMGSLTQLRSVNLNNNSLISIPSDEAWRSMTYLSEVRLNSNRNLNGPLPVFWNDRNSYVLTIDFSGCSFTGNVPSINSTRVSTLIFSNNALEGSILPIIYGQNMRTFRVDRNSLTGSLPSSIGTVGTGFTSLNIFDVSFNRLTGSIPPSFSNILGSLTELTFNNNGIEGLLPNLALAYNLDILKGHNTNVRLCDVNPGIPSNTECSLYDVKFPGSCGCESWYTRCVTNTTCPSPDYVAPVSPPGAAAPTPVLPPGSSPILPPGVPAPLPPLPSPTNAPTDGEPSGAVVPVGSAPSSAANLYLLLLVFSIGVIML